MRLFKASQFALAILVCAMTGLLFIVNMFRTASLVGVFGLGMIWFITWLLVSVAYAELKEEED